MKYNYLLFDADDTLFDYSKTEGFALSKAFEHYRIPLTDEIIQTYRSINQKLWDEFERGSIDLVSLRSERFRRLNLALNLNLTADYQELSQIYLDYLAKGTFIVDQAVQVCKVLSQMGLTMAIITNGIREVQHQRIRGSELSSYFDTIIVSEDAGCQKPHTGIFDYTFEKLEITEKQQVMIIGDSLSSDIKGGYMYGIDTCWFNPTHKLNQTEISPTYEIDQLDQLLQILD